MSCDVCFAGARRTTISPSISSHSSTDPGPIRSFRRIAAGIVARPCAVIFVRRCGTSV
jgi:hypothetical protein